MIGGCDLATGAFAAAPNIDMFSLWFGVDDVSIWFDWLGIATCSPKSEDDDIDI